MREWHDLSCVDDETLYRQGNSGGAVATPTFTMSALEPPPMATPKTISDRAGSRDGGWLLCSVPKEPPPIPGPYPKLSFLSLHFTVHLWLKNYLRKVVEEVGTDLYRIYRQIHKDTNLPLQKIVSQRAGIVAYLDMQKTVKTGSIRKRIINQNAMGVAMIIENILRNTELAHNPSKRTEFLTTLLFMSTVDRHADDGIRAPLLWSTEEGTGKTSTLKVIPEAIKKTMVTDAAGVGANDFQVQQNVFVLEDVTLKDITEDKRGVVWALATGGSTSVKVHSTSKTISPKWVIGTSNEDIPNACDQMTRGSRKEQAVIRWMESRFMLVKYNKKYRGEAAEQCILLDNDARMELFVSVMTEIAANPGYYRRQYESNVFKALYMVEAARLLEETYPEHQLFKSRNYRTVIEGLHNYVETHQTEMILAENQDRQDYDLMMGNISEGLGLRTEAEEERIGQELETVMRDIAAMEGIDLDELLATPMPEEETVAEEIQNNLNDTWLNTTAHQALMNATILPPNIETERPPASNPEHTEEPQPSTVLGDKRAHHR